MKHARTDYDRIQDPAGLIPEDEPVFLLRGQDVFAPDAIHAWADAAQAHGADPAIIAAARRQASAMVNWQLEGRGKVPDMPADAVRP